MRCTNKINHQPYFPPVCIAEEKKPYVCRLAPFLDGFEFEWFDKNSDKAHKVFYRIRGEAEEAMLPVKERTVRIEGLREYCDYEFYVESAEGVKSNIRLVRTGEAPEGAIVVNYLHPEDDQYAFSGRYLCDPSLARLKNGRLIAGMSVYEPEKPQNLTLLYYSDDNGDTWHYLTDIFPFFWASLFYYRDVLYMIGFHSEYSDLQIACSKDGGETWSVPVVLIYGASNKSPFGGPHRAPMHFSEYNGRLYTDIQYGSWNIGSHRPGVLSIGVDENLMVPENWCCTGFLPYEGKWKEETGIQYDTMEGSVVCAPDGQLYEYLRWTIGSALRLKVDKDDPEKMLTYDKVIEMPVSNSMFRLFPYHGKYFLVTNRKTEKEAEYKATGFHSYRNVLSIYSSDDLEEWKFICDVVNREEEDASMIGFQYPTMLAEEKELLLLVRSGYNGAHSYHDSNTSLFFKIPVEKLGV